MAEAEAVFRGLLNFLFELSSSLDPLSLPACFFERLSGLDRGVRLDVELVGLIRLTPRPA